MEKLLNTLMEKQDGEVAEHVDGLEKQDGEVAGHEDGPVIGLSHRLGDIKWEKQDGEVAEHIGGP
eukprot:1197975-Ditylum_brightwellii.AAC.2